MQNKSAFFKTVSYKLSWRKAIKKYQTSLKLTFSNLKRMLPNTHLLYQGSFRCYVSFDVLRSMEMVSYVYMNSWVLWFLCRLKYQFHGSGFIHKWNPSKSPLASHFLISPQNRSHFMIPFWFPSWDPHLQISQGWRGRDPRRFRQHARGRRGTQRRRTLQETEQKKAAKTSL